MFTKFLIVLMLLLIAVPGSGQITGYKDISDLVDGTYWDDLITETFYNNAIYDTDLGLRNSGSYVVRYLTSVDSSLDTIMTQPIVNRAYGDHFISFTSVSDSASDAGVRPNPDTIIVYLDMGVFRGNGTVSSTAGATVDGPGIKWYNLWTVTQDTSIEVSLKDSTWWTDFPSPMYWYRLRETSAQSNKYYLSDFQFKQD